jgi:cobalt ECF transporter T component CbiQ
MRRRSFVERTIHHLQSAAERSVSAENYAAEGGLLQRLDPRSKVLGLLGLAVAAVWTRSLTALLTLLAITVFLAAASKLPVRLFMPAAGALLLALTVALPSVFLTPGEPVFKIPLAGTATLQGIRTAVFLVLRVATATASSSLLILTTPWVQVLKALRVFRVPVVAIVILSMTYRYLFVLLRTAIELFEARESRRVGRLTRGDSRRLIASGAGVLLSKTLSMSEEVYLAMRSRGFQGEVYVLTDLRMRSADWIFLVLLISVDGALGRMA